VSTFSEEIEVENVHSVIVRKLTEDPLIGKPGSPLNFTITLENAGNAEETISLTVLGTVRHGLVVFKQSLYGGTITTLDINPGETKTIIVVISLYDALEENAESAVQFEGILSDSSKTDTTLLFYNVEVEDVVDPNGNGNNGDTSEPSGLLSGTLGLALIAIIIIVVVMIVVILFVVKGKKKEQDMKKADMDAKRQAIAQYQNSQADQMAPADASGAVFSGEVVADYQMVESAPGFDQQTGQPTAEVPAQPQAPRFDPQTGEPLPQLPEAPQNGLRFDPQTGQPIMPEGAEVSEVSEVAQGSEGSGDPVDAVDAVYTEVGQEYEGEVSFECPECGTAITSNDPSCPGCGVVFE
jgi:rubrerythrin